MADPTDPLRQLQEQLTWLYRIAYEAEHSEPRPPQSHVLVVVDLPAVRAGVRLAFERLEVSLSTTAAVDLMQSRLPAQYEPVLIGPRRVVRLVRRCADLQQRIVRYRELLDARLALAPSRGQCRVGVAELPATAAAAGDLAASLTGGRV